MENNLCIVLNGNESLSGKWTYNRSSCTLNVNPDQNKEAIHILIGKITSTHLEGLLYKQNDYANSMKVIFAVSAE